MNHSHLLTEQLKGGIFSALVVDDDPDIVSGLKDILEDSGYTVETAACAAQARDLLRQNTFSIMVSDYSLPDDNAIHLSRDAKKLQPSLGLILMTGHDPRHIREKLNSVDMEFMRKPVDVSMLLGALERAIQRQCDALKISRPKTVAPWVENIPLPMPVTGRVALPNYPMAKRKRTIPMAWAATALIGFGTGWISRTAILSRPGNTPMNSNTQPGPAMVWLPAGTATITDAKIVPPAQAPTPVVEVKVVALKIPQDHLSQLADEDPAVRIKAAKILLKSSPHDAMALKTLL